jgi:hypothetical protein
MEFQHVNVKLLIKNAKEVDIEALIPVFHGWIENQASGELLLDIADYRHVSAGPGLVLIGHYGNYSLDNSGGRPGVRYNCKIRLEGTNQDRLAQATRDALAACRRLEADPRLQGTIQFNGHEMEVFLNDRLLAPNTAQAREAADTEFRAFFSTLFEEAAYTMEYAQDSRSLLSVRVRTSRAFDTADLLKNLHSMTLASPQK